jgi:hypothetical protein
MLEHHIATGRYERDGKALTNFAKVLPASEGDLVRRSERRLITAAAL